MLDDVGAWLILAGVIIGGFFYLRSVGRAQATKACKEALEIYEVELNAGKEQRERLETELRTAEGKIRELEGRVKELSERNVMLESLLMGETVPKAMIDAMYRVGEAVAGNTSEKLHNHLNRLENDYLEPMVSWVIGEKKRGENTDA